METRASTHYDLRKNWGFYLQTARRLFHLDMEEDFNLYQEIEDALLEHTQALDWQKKPTIPLEQITVLQREIEAARERGKALYDRRFYRAHDRFETTAQRRDPHLIPVLSRQREDLDFIADEYVLFFENEDPTKQKSMWNTLLGRKSLATYVQEQDARMRLMRPLSNVHGDMGRYVVTHLFPDVRYGGGPFPGYTVVRTQKSMRAEIAHLERDCKRANFIEAQLWCDVMDTTVRKPTTENIDVYHKLTAHIFDIPYSGRERLISGNRARELCERVGTKPPGT